MGAEAENCASGNIENILTPNYPTKLVMETPSAEMKDKSDQMKAQKDSTHVGLQNEVRRLQNEVM